MADGDIVDALVEQVGGMCWAVSFDVKNSDFFIPVQ
jgi:hypothetical protein